MEENNLKPWFESQADHSIVITKLLHQFKTHVTVLIIHFSPRRNRKNGMGMIYFFELNHGIH